MDSWDTATWEKLHFVMRDAHYYRYEYQSAGDTADGGTATFTARALGDLDCDGVDEVQEITGEFISDVVTTGTWTDPASATEPETEVGTEPEVAAAPNGNGNGNTK